LLLLLLSPSHSESPSKSPAPPNPTETNLSQGAAPFFKGGNYFVESLSEHVASHTAPADVLPSRCNLRAKLQFPR